MFKIKNKKTLALLGVLIILPLLIASVFIVQKRFEFRIGAAPETSLSISAPTQANIGDEFSTNILINTSSNTVSAVELKIDFPADKLQAISIEKPIDGFLPIILTAGTIDNTAGTASIILGCSPSEPKQGTGTLALITFQAIGEGEAQISFNPGTQAAAINETGNVVDATTSHTLTVLPTAQPSLSLSPLSGQHYISDEFPVEIRMSTAGQAVYGVDVVIQYDSARLSVIDAESETAGTQIVAGSIPNFESYPVNTVNQAAGTIEFTAHVSPPTTVSGDNLLLATINFRALQEGTATVNFDFTEGEKNDTNLVGADQTTDILAQVNNASYTLGTAPTPTPVPTPIPTPTPTPLPTPTPTPAPTGAPPTPTPTPTPIPTPIPTPTPTPLPTPTPTPTPTPVPTTYLSLKIILQGRNEAGISNARAITIRVVGTNFETTMTTSTIGETTSLQLTGVAPGTYDVLVKPEGFLQRKFSMQIVGGNNHLDTSTSDLSQPVFLGGDLDGSGAINSLDYVRLLRIGSQPVYKTNDLLADLDASGQVNSIDFAIMASNWGKTDEN